MNITHMTEEQIKFQNWLSERRLDELDWIYQAVIDAEHKVLLKKNPPPTFASSKQADGQDNKKEPAYTDVDKMPWGKHRGVAMQDVPTDYLAWLWHNEGGCSDMKVKNYIWNSRHALNEDLPKEKYILTYRTVNSPDEDGNDCTDDESWDE